LLSQSLNIESDKRDVEKVRESDDELINEELHDDTVGVGLDTEMSLHFCQFLGQRTVNIFINDISYYNMD
jgi:hypothetical protein